MLYKFHRINQFLYSLLLDSKLWFSTPNEFNDPFDLRFISGLQTNKRQKDSAINNLIIQLSDNKIKFNKSKVRQALQKQSKMVDFDKRVNDIIVNDFQTLGICCFSKTIDNILMWSHYADSHKGVCLEFDFRIDDPLKRHLRKVSYSWDFPTITSLFDYEKGVITKAKCWHYENEYRMIHQTPGLHKFNKSSLKGIIFGAKTDTHEVEKIVNLIKNNGYSNVTFKKASISSVQYKLELNNI